MSGCTDVCEVVIDMLVGRQDYEPNDDENHDDIIEALGKFVNHYDALLGACEGGLKFLASMSSGIGLESERQNKQAFRKMLITAIAAGGK